MKQRQQQVLRLLSATPRWLTATAIAEQLGVTPRSVRSYVAAVNASADTLVIASSPEGYRLVGAPLPQDQTAALLDPLSPEGRAVVLLRRVLDAREPLDVFALADELHVSDSTIESDLARLRARLEGHDLVLHRAGGSLAVVGSERSVRGLLVELVLDEPVDPRATLRARFPDIAVDAFTTDLIELIRSDGATVNDFGLTAFVTHAVIAIDRVRVGRTLPPTEAPANSENGFRDAVATLVQRHADAVLPETDLEHLLYVLATRVLTPAPESATVTDEERERLRDIVVQAGREFYLELDDEEFLTRLAMHVRNLTARSQDSTQARNPLTRAMKTGSPLLYELSVHITQQLQIQHDIIVNDDEIAYIAMHVGSQVEQRRKSEGDPITVTVVSPSYHSVHLAVLEGLDRAFGADLAVVEVSTRADIDWERVPGDLVISTVAPPTAHTRVIVAAPFLGDNDVARVRMEIARVRRRRRAVALTESLTGYLQPELFFRDIAGTPEEIITRLGSAMRSLGILDDEYIAGAIERERMSSTAFTDSLAVPHAMTMTAHRTAIALALSDTPIDWNGTRVNVIAFIAFSAADGAQFRAAFDQFVEMFSERDVVARLLKRSTDYERFLAEIRAIAAD